MKRILTSEEAAPIKAAMLKELGPDWRSGIDDDGIPVVERGTWWVVAVVVAKEVVGFTATLRNAMHDGTGGRRSPSVTARSAREAVLEAMDEVVKQHQETLDYWKACRSAQAEARPMPTTRMETPDGKVSFV